MHGRTKAKKKVKRKKNEWVTLAQVPGVGIIFHPPVCVLMVYLDPGTRHGGIGGRKVAIEMKRGFR